MDFELFNEITAEYKHKKPILFALEHDKIISAEEAGRFEQTIQLELPPKFKQFLLEYGGGYFGYANVYSLDKDGFFYLLKYNDPPIDRYLRIADNGCGDSYLLSIDNQKCLDRVLFYDHETKNVCETEYADILEYLIAAGLKAGVEKTASGLQS